jgi:beta-lactamase superfamily II metal-dependent hydrolase
MDVLGNLKGKQAKKLLAIPALVVIAFFILTGCSMDLPLTTQISQISETTQARQDASDNQTKQDASDTQDQQSGTAAQPDQAGTAETQQAGAAALSGHLLKVHFIDVGQADSILVELPNKQTMLVDAGNNEDAEVIEDYIDSLGIKKLDYVIGTHPHEDHIGSLDNIIKDYSIGEAFMPAISHTSKSYKDVIKAFEAANLKCMIPEPGSDLLNTVVSEDSGKDQDKLEIRFLSPYPKKYDEINEYSIVLKISYGDIDMLLMGDAEYDNEMELIEQGYDLDAELLKVGHHGSDSSTSSTFLKYVNPDYAVISVGSDNDYGFPKAGTIRHLLASGANIYRTDKMGTITAVSDGESIVMEPISLLK